MIRDIENAEYYGADFDKKEWLELLDLLKLILSFIEKIIILMELKGKKRKKVELKEMK